MSLYGQLLPAVPLRFNSANRGAVQAVALRGMRQFGPYDMTTFPKRQLTCGLLYPAAARGMRDALVNGLQHGEGSGFPGFSQLFRVDLTFDSAHEEVIRGLEDKQEYQRAASRLARANCDLVFIVGIRPDSGIYQACKETLLLNGVPCQVLATKRFNYPNQRPWILGNLSLASYAKVGGTPWVVADPQARRELVMGVSRAKDAENRYVVGFVTLFNQDGDFLFLNAQTPVVEWSDYLGNLERMVVEAYHDYQQGFGAPESLVVHFHKRPGEGEVEAVEQALRNLGVAIPFALLHLNEYSLFRAFDTAHSTYVPPTGLQVDLSRRRALLLLDGLEQGKRNRRGVPNVWDVSMDRRSTLEVEEFPRLVQQIQRFARVNWRGFNARSTPVTMNYAKLICDLVLEIGLGSWSNIITNGRLRDKAWFL